MKTTTLCFLSFLIVGLCGCANSDNAAQQVQVKAVTPTATSATDPRSTDPSSQPMAKMGENVETNAPVVHDPKDVKEGGSFKLAPSNPNDPHFQPDPKLGGG